jgi:hypothetical protein
LFEAELAFNVYKKSLEAIMRKRHYLVGFVIACVLSLVPPAFATDACFSQQLTIQPAWISTLQFDGTRNEILIADPKNTDLLSYKVKTSEMEKVKIGLSPAMVTRIQGGFFVESEKDAAFLAPDRSEKHVDLQVTRQATGAIQLGSLYSNWITRGPDFIGFGSVHGAGSVASEHAAIRGFKLGFIKGTVTADTQKFENVRLIDETEKNDFYLLGLSYFAANDDGLFYVRMIRGEEPSIKWVQPNGSIKDVLAFPSGFGDTRPLKKEGEASNAARMFEMVASRAMPYGLFGQGHYLYLLTRQPMLGQETQWLIHRIDPLRQELAGVVRLPTTAEHLSVAVGKDEWYFVERGSVRAWGNQDINTMLQIPQAWITLPDTSPLKPERPMPQCAQRTSVP